MSPLRVVSFKIDPHAPVRAIAAVSIVGAVEVEVVVVYEGSDRARFVDECPIRISEAFKTATGFPHVAFSFFGPVVTIDVENLGAVRIRYDSTVAGGWTATLEMTPQLRSEISRLLLLLPHIEASSILANAPEAKSA